MNNLTLSEEALQAELERIIHFIQAEVGNFKVVLGLSGGIDSDVTARLCQRALGSERMKCFIILQDAFETKYIQNVHNLADDLGIRLVEVPLGPFPQKMISILAQNDPQAGLRTERASVDVASGKNALRTFVNAIYAEHGHLVVGTTNRTELELGYFLALGDHVAHICPIMHLYKTQARQLAQFLGSRAEVINQAPAAGCRLGDEDLIGIAGLLYQGSSMMMERTLDPEGFEAIRKIYRQLSYFALDQALIGIDQGWEVEKIAEFSKLSLYIVERLIQITGEVRLFRRRPFGVGLAVNQ